MGIKKIRQNTNRGDQDMGGHRMINVRWQFHITNYDILTRINEVRKVLNRLSIKFDTTLYEKMFW